MLLALSTPGFIKTKAPSTGNPSGFIPVSHVPILFQSSLYHTSDGRTALDSAERRSGGFNAPLYAATINAQSFDNRKNRPTNRPFFFPYRAFRASPVPSPSYKR
jgi:hypothetical protein